MTIKFSQFLAGSPPITLPRNTDILVGLRDGLNEQSLFGGVTDSLGANLVTWLQGAGPNVNYISLQNNITANSPIISTLGADANVNLTIGCKGAGVVTIAGTSNMVIPGGTSVQALASVGGGIRYNFTSQYFDYWSTVSNSWVDLTAGSVLSNLTYITKIDETASAPNSVPLSGLSSGFLCSTTATGVLAARTLTGAPLQIAVANGTGVAGNPVISIDTGYVGQASITTLGTITTGIWDGSTIASTFGGSGLTNLTATAHGILVAEGASAFTPIVLTSGQLLIGSTGADPIAATITNGTGISVANGIGSITIANTGIVTISGTANQIAVSGTTNTTLSIASNPVFPGTGGATVPTGTTGQRAGSAGTIRFNSSTSLTEFTNDGTNWAAIGAGSGNGTALQDTITQASHGFSVQQLLYLNGTTYTLAEANSITAAEVVGIVTTVTNSNTFVLTTSGKCTGLSGLTAGTVYWLSDGTAGLLTATAPTTVGNIAKPVFVADSTTSGYFINYRGEVIPASGGVSGALIGFQVFKSSGTYTPSAGANSVMVKAWGAGGGGGSTNSGSIGGPGGGGGAHVEAFFSISGLTPATITIGSGGAGGGANNASNGVSGGATSFGTTLVAAPGAGAISGTSEGAGGAIVACTIPSGGFAIAGGKGGGVNASIVSVASGGSSFGSLGIAYIPGPTAASVANSGMGGAGGNNTLAGMAGGAGLMIIEEYT